MIQYKIFHETIFHYSTSVSFSHNIARLKPAQTHYQRLEAYELEVHPNTNSIKEYQDYFGNTLSKIFIKQSHQKLKVTAHSVVSVNKEKIDEKIKFLKKINISFEELRYDLQSVNEETLYAKLV